MIKKTNFLSWLKLQKSPGKTSTILLVLGIVLIIVIVIVYTISRFNTLKNANNNSQPENSPEVVVEPPKPVYETKVGDVKFIFQSAEDLGSILISKNKALYQNLNTTEKFIKVTVGAQNKGKVNVPQQSWEIGNIIDSDGRNFISIDIQAYYFLPNPNLCGALLKPEFDPVPCVKYYEVSKASTGLKIAVYATLPGATKKEASLLDLDVK